MILNNFFVVLGVLGIVSVCFSAKISNANNGADNPKNSRPDIQAPSFRQSLGRSLKSDTENCDALLTEYNPALKQIIADYQDDADKIIELITKTDFKGATYQELHNLVDKYPIRQSGFQNLEDSIDYMMERMEAFGLVNVRGEQVSVPHWVRGEEKAELLEPHQKSLPILGLGTSVGTPGDGIEAEVLVVKSFDDLAAKQEEAKGKIVVYNQGWLGSYGVTNGYRSKGASEASKFGAVATLIESVADFSLNTPHTGGQNYDDAHPRIPTACITKEDADFLYRLQEKGEKIKVHLKMLDYNLPETTSRNVIGEIVGQNAPNEFVALSGHIDSWDVGQGAMDDGGGVMISVMALAALKNLSLTTHRTLQAILWTSEEVGLVGVEKFVDQHEDILPNYSVVFESDSGTFLPLGLDFYGSELAGCIVNEVLQLTKAINTTTYTKSSSPVSSDITKIQAKGVPGLSLNNANDKYFWYHHTHADTISMIDATELDLDAALFAVTSYVLANLPEKLPREVPPAP